MTVVWMVRKSSQKLFETSQPGHLSQPSLAVLRSWMKVLILSAPLKLTTMELSEAEYPVKPLTPEERLAKERGVLILYSWQYLQFQALIERTLSQEIADIQAIQRATGAEQAAWTVFRRREAMRSVMSADIFIVRYDYWMMNYFNDINLRILLRLQKILLDGQNQDQNRQQILLILRMEHLLDSRLSRNQSPTKLQNLSPEKFGKGAFASLTYTPSKLADNVLFRQATTFKKIEETSSKVRESEAYNGLLKDRLSQLEEQRDGIEATLTQQLVMYKKMLNENEIKQEQRIREIQKTFNEEMQRFILSKEEEAKFTQSEKELLENRIAELEQEVASLRDKLDHGGSNFNQLTSQHQKLEIHYKNTCEKLEQTEKRMKEEGEKAKADFEELSRKLFNTEVQFKGQINQLQLDREREKQNLERFHRTELEKVENKRIQEALIKNQELKDLAATFEGQANRLKDIINSKERSIEGLGNALNDEKEKIVELTKNYTAEITNLVHQKGRFKQEIDELNGDLAQTRDEYRNYQVNSQKTVANLQSVIAKLKDDLELNQVNFVREKDRSQFVMNDLHRQIVNLKADNDHLSVIGSENNLLCKQIRNLKDLLLQSSLEMERCKEEFIRIGREKDHLVVKVRELGYENETLHRMKVQKDEEARGWRESYYLSRR